MKKTTSVEIKYECRFQTKSAVQKILYTKSNKYGIQLLLEGCCTDMADLEMLHKFIGDVISDIKKQ